MRFALPVSPGYHFEHGPGGDKTAMTANSNGDRPLPFSEDDEKGLLCSQLREPANVWDICADRNIRPDAFYVPAHHILHSILLELSKDAQCIAADGKIDFVPLKRALKDRGQLEEIGGEHWLSALYDFVPTAANAAWYADIIRDRWERRRAISDGKEQIDLASDLSVDNWDADGKYQSRSPARQLIEFLSPSEIVSYQAPPGIVLVGDQHITRGSIFIIGGAPGVGKSRAAVALAEAGATSHDWFGLKVHSKFKTLIIQNENGRFRLKQEFSELNSKLLDGYVRITPPPPCGLCFDRFEFRQQLSEALEVFDPGIVLIDPWNAVTRDDRQKDYLGTFELIRAVIPSGDLAPAIGIIAHTRKPLSGERASGRALLNLLAGSYVLGSMPRCVFVMQSASDDVAEDRIVWTCCKNNDGELGDRSAWIRCNGLFDPVSDFDWDAWNSDGQAVKIGVEIIAKIIEENGGAVARDILRDKIEGKGLSRRTAYRRIEEAEKLKLIKFHKGKDAYELY